MRPDALLERIPVKNVLTIAGSDCSGGAGIQADLKTMCALGVYGMSAVTAVTVQNTQKVYAVQEMSPAIVAGQIDAVMDDIPVDAVKIGMMANAGNIRVIHDRLLARRTANIVLDPVMISKSGCSLLDREAEDELRRLIPAADLVTPNMMEAGALAGMKVTDRDAMREAARAIAGLGAKNVLVKGGLLEGDADDLLLLDGVEEWLRSPRVDTGNIQGTGCSLSSAIACHLARGETLRAATEKAKAFVTRALRDSLSIGRGVGPLGHMVQLYREAGRL